MAEHVRPLCLDLVSERRIENCLQRRGIDTDMCALGFENLRHVASASDQVRMPVRVDDVIQVAGTAPLSQGSEFLAEQFGQ